MNRARNGGPARGCRMVQDLRLVQAGTAAEAAVLEHRSGAARTPRSGVLGRYRSISKGLALSDAVCVVVALQASYSLRYPGQFMPAREALVAALAPMIWI